MHAVVGRRDGGRCRRGAAAKLRADALPLTACRPLAVRRPAAAARPRARPNRRESTARTPDQFRLAIRRRSAFTCPHISLRSSRASALSSPRCDEYRRYASRSRTAAA